MMVPGASDGRFVQKAVKVRPVRASIFTQAQRTRGSLSSAIPNEGVRNSWHAIKGEALFYGVENMHAGTLKLGYNLMRHGYVPESEFRNLPKREHMMLAFAAELTRRGVDIQTLCPKETFEKLFDPKSEQNGAAVEKLSMYRTQDLDHLPDSRELQKFRSEDAKSWLLIDNGKVDPAALHARSQGLYAWVNRNARKVVLGKLVSGAASKTERQLLLQQLSRIPEDNILGGKQKIINGLRAGDVKQVRDAFVDAFYRSNFGEKPGTPKQKLSKKAKTLLAIAGISLAFGAGTQNARLLNAVQQHFKEQAPIERTIEQEQQGQEQQGQKETKTQTTTTERTGPESTPINEDLKNVLGMLKQNVSPIFKTVDNLPGNELGASIFVIGNADAITDPKIMTQAETRIQLYESKSTLTPNQRANYEQLKALLDVSQKTKEIISQTELSNLEADAKQTLGVNYEPSVRNFKTAFSLKSAIEAYDAINP